MRCVVCGFLPFSSIRIIHFFYSALFLVTVVSKSKAKMFSIARLQRSFQTRHQRIRLWVCVNVCRQRVVNHKFASSSCLFENLWDSMPISNSIWICLFLRTRYIFHVRLAHDCESHLSIILLFAYEQFYSHIFFSRNVCVCVMHQKVS